MRQVDLATESGSLSVVAEERDWCTVTLNAQAKSILLGAERFDYIASHLLSFLGQEGPGLRWVLSFAEQHVSVYGEWLADKLVFRFQDSGANWFAALELTPVDSRNGREP